MNEQVDRLAELEAELARIKRERDMYKADVHRLRKAEIEELPPMTVEEVREMMAAPQGESFDSIIAEYQTRLNTL
jgi:predicted nuclease with TOPRIM domain